MDSPFPRPSNFVPGDEPELIPSEEGYLDQVNATQGAAEFSMQQLLLRQSQALTALVSQMANQDGLDFQAAGSGSGISLKGSAKRDKLLADLTARRRDFAGQSRASTSK